MHIHASFGRLPQDCPFPLLVSMLSSADVGSYSSEYVGADEYDCEGVDVHLHSAINSRSFLDCAIRALCRA